MNELELNHRSRAEARHDGPPDGALLITRQSIERSDLAITGAPVEPVVEAVQPTLTWLLGTVCHGCGGFVAVKPIFFHGERSPPVERRRR